jgi:hypothetical protein
MRADVQEGRETAFLLRRVIIRQKPYGAAGALIEYLSFNGRGK